MYQCSVHVRRIVVLLVQFMFRMITTVSELVIENRRVLISFCTLMKYHQVRHISNTFE